MPPPAHSSTAAPPTVFDLKHEFLLTQTRLLAQPLAPSRTWHRTVAAQNTTAARDGEDDDNNNNNTPREPDAALNRTNNNNNKSRPIPPRALDDAIQRLNNLLAQHHRRVYHAQATRLVAEQIEKLYWNGADHGTSSTGVGLAGEEDESAAAAAAAAAEVLCRGVDYTSISAIELLPETWPSVVEQDADPAGAAQYTDLVARMQHVVGEREDVLKRVRRLRRMREMLTPFDVDGGVAEEEEEGQEGNVSGIDEARRSTVQENLVTRNGELEKELEKMRVLLARVGDKVSKVKGKRRREEGDDGDVGSHGLRGTSIMDEQEKKVDDLLDTI